MNNNSLQRALTHWLPALGIAAVVFYFAQYLYLHAVNVPYADDIRDVLLFLTNVSQSSDWAHSLELFFGQLNEHRTLSSRIVYYLVFLVQGEANFRTLIFVANLALPLFLLMFYLAVRQQRYALLMLLPVAMILFQMRFYYTIFWSMNAFAFMFSYVYALACLSCLQRVSAARLFAAIVFALLATFTLASGQLLWGVGLVCLLHQAYVLRAAKLIHIVVWVFATVAALSLYYMDYVHINKAPLLLQNFFSMPLEVMRIFLVLMGRAFSDSNALVAGTGGAVMLLVVVCSTVYHVRRHTITLELFACYIIASIGVIALARASLVGILGLDMSQAWGRIAFAERLVFPSVLLLATTVTILLSRLPVGRGKLALGGVLAVLAAVYCVSSYRLSAESLEFMQMKIIAGHNKQNYWEHMTDRKETRALVQRAVTAGVYIPPPRPLPMPKLSDNTAGLGERMKRNSAKSQ